LLFCSSRTIDRWVKRFHREGVEAVAGHKPGRPFRFSTGWLARARPSSGAKSKAEVINFGSCNQFSGWSFSATCGSVLLAIGCIDDHPLGVDLMDQDGCYHLRCAARRDAKKGRY
jgi:hypothetical protein